MSDFPKVGCCGFKISQRRYAGQFPVVEVQQTFYEPPTLGELKRWRGLVPPDFEFTLKAWQLITHRPESPTYRRLKTLLRPEEAEQCGNFQPTPMVDEAWSATRACAQALRAQMILFQCPASFTPLPANVEQMRDFFRNIKRDGLRLLWEPRGGWPPELVESICRELDLVHVVDPMIATSVTPEFKYFRLHGGKDYHETHSDDQLRRLRDIVCGGGPAYVLFNNLDMIEDASRFRAIALPEARPMRVARNLEFKWAL